MNVCSLRKLKSTKFSNFNALKMAKIAVLEPLDPPKFISHKIWVIENREISTLWICVNLRLEKLSKIKVQSLWNCQNHKIFDKKIFGLWPLLRPRNELVKNMWNHAELCRTVNLIQKIQFLSLQTLAFGLYEGQK